MTKYPTALAASERVLKVLSVVNVVYGVGVFALLIASLVAPAFTSMALAGKPLPSSAIRAMQLLMVVGLAAVPVTQVLLNRLRDILLTVRTGDPFVAENARRLNGIALGVLALELLRLAVGVIVSETALDGLGIRVRAGFAFTPWVAVLLLFVLARVFEEGTRMRDDLEGTV